MKTKAIYTGLNGAHYHGIPARDISEEEWEQLTPKQQKMIAKSPIYDLVVKKTAKRSNKQTAKKE